MYTYELTPNLKTKSYRILDNGVEVCRSLAKKTAKAMCDTVNKLQTALLEAQNHVESITQSATPELNQSSNTSENNTTSDSPDFGDNNPGISGHREGVSPARAQYIADAQQQLSTTATEALATSERCGIAARQHKINAEQHRREAEQHRRNAAVWLDLASQLSVLTGIPVEQVDIGGAYPELPYQLDNKNSSPAITGRDDNLSYRTIDTRAI